MDTKTMNALINMVHPDYLLEMLQHEGIEMDENYLYVRGKFNKYIVKQSDITAMLGLYGELIEKERLLLKFYEYANYTITMFNKDKTETFYCFLVKSEKESVLKLPVRDTIIDAMEEEIYESDKDVYDRLKESVKTFLTCPETEISPEQVMRDIWECFVVK